MQVTYTLTDSDTFATLRDETGRIVGTLTRPAVLRFMRPEWTVSNRDGTIIMRRNLRPTKLAIARAIADDAIRSEMRSSIHNCQR